MSPYKVLYIKVVKKNIAQNFKKVGECPSSFKKEIYVDRRIGYVEVDIPTTVKVYRQIHDYEWYKNVMLKTLTNAVMSV